MMTDPIADLLTRIRNGNHARKERVDVPWSKIKERVTAVLVEEGFLRDFAVVGEGPAKELRIGLKLRRAATPGDHRHPARQPAEPARLRRRRETLPRYAAVSA